MKYKEKPQLPTTLHQAHRIIRMITREGFCELFEEELIKARKIDPKITYQYIFNNLNLEFKKSVGEFRYIDYNSFKRRVVIAVSI